MQTDYDDMLSDAYRTQLDSASPLSDSYETQTIAYYPSLLLPDEGEA
jgi:hypothetical protein